MKVLNRGEFSTIERVWCIVGQTVGYLELNRTTF